MEARKLRLVSSHYDKSEPWAREPRLREVVKLREVRAERRSRGFGLFSLGLGLGYLVAALLG